MPKELRSDLHERFGRWLETNRSEYEEIVGYHFEQAFRLKEQLGPVDDELRALGARAGRLLGHAGHRAYERGDGPAAVTLLARSVDLLPPADPVRLQHLVELGYALFDAAELERAQATFTQAIDEAGTAGDQALEARAKLGRIFVHAQTGGAFAAPQEAAAIEIAKLEQLQDDAGLAEGWYVLAAFQSWLGNSELGGASYQRAIDHARLAGNRRIVTAALAFRVLLQSWGFRNAVDGLRETDELLVTHAGTSIEPPLRLARALHLSFLGEHEASREDQILGSELYRQFGNELLRAASNMSRASSELRAGSLDAAEAAARQGIDALEQLGGTGFLSTTVGLLAETLYRQGRYDEAEKLAGRTAELAMVDDFDPLFRWRAVLARVLAQRGEFVEAEKLAREGVDIVEQTDWHLHRGEAFTALGEVLELAGRRNEARAVYEQAVDAFERKGSLPDLEATRQRIAALR
jgi:tetratricopeptide (TPR) repeat protein